MKTTNKITEMKAISNDTGVQAMDSSSPDKEGENDEHNQQDHRNER